ncbi:DUF6338 family protein [Raoultella ornithinolytica]|uniref:DUF6338 family protein n=1 Tax=Raoultella ornithinolytica TaxID=54291 RepID=UPI0022475080|nr:DUF6338 family protein [Raoultella ornithinolytica]MCW9581302.1 DUF6338 family protein [Raoultella ornithinolytica]
MESLSTELFNILKYLLPGFLTAWIFYAFTSYPKPSQFERVVQALIFTIFVQGLTFVIKDISLLIGEKWHSFGTWTADVGLAWSYISAILIGFIFSLFANTDRFHAFLRRIKVTKQTSYHCEWFGAFHSREEQWVVLQLCDGRRVMGWPHEWPSDPSKGHFVLMEPSWLDGEEEIKLPQIEIIIFKVTDIKWVEFLNKP